MFNQTHYIRILRLLRPKWLGTIQKLFHFSDTIHIVYQLWWPLWFFWPCKYSKILVFLIKSQFSKASIEQFFEKVGQSVNACWRNPHREWIKSCLLSRTNRGRTLFPYSWQGLNFSNFFCMKGLGNLHLRHGREHSLFARLVRRGQPVSDSSVFHLGIARLPSWKLHPAFQMHLRLWMVGTSFQMNEWFFSSRTTK